MKKNGTGIIKKCGWKKNKNQESAGQKREILKSEFVCGRQR